MTISSGFSKSFLPGYQVGVMGYRYKGVLCNKSPIDMAIYQYILWQLQPGTIIEIGYKEGGSALWFSDMVKAMNLNTKIVSVDRIIPEKPVVEELMLLQGDVNQLGRTLTDQLLKSLPSPWLVIEDSAHTFQGCTSALSFFADKLQTGDYLVIEDGILSELGMAEKYQGGPNKAIETFFEQYPDVYRIDRECCDMFGENVTYNPNGYLIKT